MDDAKFQGIADKGIQMIRTALSGLAPGDAIAYNAYWRGQEVVVLGYQYDTGGGHTNTRPLAIMVDDEIFDSLLVDQESGRWDSQGNDVPPMTP